MKRNIKLILEYDGTFFHGWQRQKLSPTIQEVLEQALSKLTGEKIHVIGSGRTDAGVHALGQVANFYTKTTIPCEGFLKGLNSILPESIAIKEAKEVEHGFHAQYSAIAKKYIYKILISEVRSPLFAKRAWHINSKGLNIQKMNEAAQYLIGEHDFSSFKASGSEVKSNVRKIISCGFKELDQKTFLPQNSKVIVFYIVANGFLRYMVRNIVGSLIEVGLEKKEPYWIKEILLLKDRKYAAKTAPSWGLYLKEVFYK